MANKAQNIASDTASIGGVLLLLGAVVALVWANAHGESYAAVFDRPVTVGAGGVTGSFTLRALVNDGLMSLFFLVVGVEIKRELVTGALNSAGKAALPAIAAVGGMVVPAGLFLAWNAGGAGQAGWGIPMATDIAFCVGILALLRDRVPAVLVVFVTALAIVDDIGGILVIALFYGPGLDPAWLAGAGATTAALVGMNRAGVVHGLVYAVAGVVLWCTLHEGGIHPTLAGVVLGLLIPARAQGFVHRLEPVVAFAVMPVFAIANSGVSLVEAGLSSFATPVALGTAVGLFIGKQAGIVGFTLLAVKLRLAPMPAGASAATLWGVSIVAGVGFTVALFIAALAYPDAPDLLRQAKVGILVGSLLAGVVGFALLRLTTRSSGDPRRRASRPTGAGRRAGGRGSRSCRRGTGARRSARHRWRRPRC